LYHLSLIDATLNLLSWFAYIGVVIKKQSPVVMPVAWYLEGWRGSRRVQLQAEELCLLGPVPQ